MATATKDKEPKKRGSRPRKDILFGRIREEEMEFCGKLAQRIPVAQAEREMGWKFTYGYQVLKRPRVQKYLEQLTKEAEKKERKMQATQVAKIKTVTRSEVINRLADLMNVKPKDTNGTIHGQVKAAETIAKILGMMVERTADLTKIFEGKTEEELDYYAVHGEWPNAHGDTGKSGDSGAEGDGPTDSEEEGEQS